MINSLKKSSVATTSRPLVILFAILWIPWDWFEGYWFLKGDSQSSFSEQAPAPGEHLFWEAPTLTFLIHSLQGVCLKTDRVPSLLDGTPFLFLDSWLEDWNLSSGYIFGFYSYHVFLLGLDFWKPNLVSFLRY